MEKLRAQFDSSETLRKKTEVKLDQMLKDLEVTSNDIQRLRTRLQNFEITGLNNDAKSAFITLHYSFHSRIEIHQLLGKELAKIASASATRDWNNQFLYTSPELESAMNIPLSEPDMLEDYDTLALQWHKNKVNEFQNSFYSFEEVLVK